VMLPLQDRWCETMRGLFGGAEREGEGGGAGNRSDEVSSRPSLTLEWSARLNGFISTYCSGA
jgi:hypothetical protein